MIPINTFYTFYTVHSSITVKEDQQNAQIIYSLNLLHLHVSVTDDHHQGACCYRVQQLNNMCIRTRYNYLQMCYPDPNNSVVR
jgi:hypothetical protein